MTRSPQTARAASTGRRDFLCRSSAAAAALALPSLSARAATPVAIGFTAVPDFGAAFIAKERGFFDKRGLDVSLKQIALTSTMPASLVSDSLQIAGMTPPVLLQAVDSGLDLVAVATGSTYVAASNAIGVVVKAGGPVATPADLQGRKIAVPGLNGTLHVLVRRWLKRRGVDLAKVTFVEVPLPQMPPVLAGGNVDAIVTAEPFITRIVESKVGTLLDGMAQDLPDGFANVLFAATRDWATKNAATVQAFRAALADAIGYAQADAAGARAAIGVYFKLPPAVLAATPMPRFQFELADPQLRFWAETMHEQAMLRKQPLIASLIAR